MFKLYVKDEKTPAIESRTCAQDELEGIMQAATCPTLILFMICYGRFDLITTEQQKQFKVSDATK